MFKKVSLLLAFLLLPGCFNNARITNFGGSPGIEQTRWVHTVIFGIVSLNEIDAHSLCGDKGVFAIRTNANMYTVILTGITGGIYSPLMVHVTCKD